MGGQGSASVTRSYARGGSGLCLEKDPRLDTYTSLYAYNLQTAISSRLALPARSSPRHQNTHIPHVLLVLITEPLLALFLEHRHAFPVPQEEVGGNKSQARYLAAAGADEGREVAGRAVRSLRPGSCAWKWGSAVGRE